MDIGIIVVLAISLGIALWQRHNAIVSLTDKQIQFELDMEESQTQFETLSNQMNLLLVDFNKIKTSEAKYKKLALVDLLTGLPNRVALTEHVDSIFLTLRQEEQVFLMDIDIDNLKDVNDSIGYTYGDELLIDVSHRLKQSLDDNDYLARINGDEFVIVSQNITSVDAYEDKIKKIQTVFSYPFTLARKEYFIQLNIGAAKLGRDGKNTQSILKSANVAMKEAKVIGKNQYCFFNEEIKSKLDHRILRKSEIISAVENNEFSLLYQPVLSLQEHKIIGVEALLRWNDPRYGTRLPYEFLSALIESGLIVSLGEQIVRSACSQFMQWKQAGYEGLSLMINLSMRQILEEGFIPMVESVIEETGISPGELIFDLDEEIIQKNKVILYPRIKKLREIGVNFGLDHFGQGECSLRLMKEIDFEYIKLDVSLIDHVESNKTEQLFLNNIVQLAKGLGHKVIYEGVEDAQQLEALEECQCDYVQGFLFSKPLTVEEIITFLDTCKEMM